MAWLRLLYESGLCGARGELLAAEEWGVEAFEAGSASGQPDAVAAFGMHLVQVRYLQGRAGELVEQSVRLARQAAYPLAVPRGRRAHPDRGRP